MGGVRGLSAIDNPNGDDESLLFLWAPNGRSASQMKRLDPDGSGGYTTYDEENMRDLMSATLDAEIGFTLGGLNNMYPVVHPESGETVHIFGFQGHIMGMDHLRWQGSRLYAGALYAIRSADQKYEAKEVNGSYAPGNPVLVSVRSFAHSPFGDDLIFVGGHDSSSRPSDDMAWIFKADLRTVVGNSG